MKRIILHQGRNESVLRHHPWIFSGAIKKSDPDISDGETIEIISSDGAWLASGSYSSHSQIRARVWSFNDKEEISEDFFRNRLEQCFLVRKNMIDPSSVNAFRLVNAESDGLPGIIVDRYGDFLVCQFLSTGAEYWKDAIAGLLKDIIPVSGIFERSDTDAREKEGLKARTGLLWGEEPPRYLEIHEEAHRFLVDIRTGHKTGFYLDQRENRAIMRDYAAGREVLNCFAYTGGFGIPAIRAGATKVVNIDTSSDLLDLAKRNFEINRADPVKIEFVAEDVFQVLRKYRDSRQQFDLIVLDPPKFVASASHLSAGARGYKDINMMAMKLLRPNGILFTFSCSGFVEPKLFQKIVADAALDAGRDTSVLRYLHQSPDHTVSLNFPEGLYLKGMVCLVK